MFHENIKLLIVNKHSQTANSTTSLLHPGLETNNQIGEPQPATARPASDKQVTVLWIAWLLFS